MTRRMWVVVGLVATTALAAALFAGLAASSHSGVAAVVHAKADSDSQQDTPGSAEGPDSAVAQDAAERAYPAEAVPFQLTANAQKAWAQFKGKANGRGKNTAGNWTLAGPSSANMPGVRPFGSYTQRFTPLTSRAFTRSVRCPCTA